MNEFDLEKFRSAWKSQAGATQERLSQDDIHAFLKEESAGVSQLFRKGLIADIVLKGLALPALLGLLVLYCDGSMVNWFNSSVMAFTLFLVFFQWKTLKAVPHEDLLGSSLRGYLENVTSFYRRRYIWTLYVSGFTGPLVFYTGSLYYIYLKYHGMRPLDTKDLVVFGVGLLLAYGIGVAAHMWQFRLHMAELDFCLQEIDTGMLTAQQVQKQRFKRRQFRLAALALCLLGLLVLSYFLVAN